MHNRNLQVVGDNITLFLNCKEHSSQTAYRNPKELGFDSASTLYIGQAGPILKGNFQVGETLAISVLMWMSHLSQRHKTNSYSSADNDFTTNSFNEIGNLMMVKF